MQYYGIRGDDYMSNAYPRNKDNTLSSLLFIYKEIISDLKNILTKLEEIQNVQ